MLTMQTVLDHLAGKEIVDALIEVMTENFEDFAEDQRKYNNAVKALQNSLGPRSGVSVMNEVEAIQMQTASNLLFSGLLGIKANLDHFLNPTVGNFLDADFEIFLRENTAKRLPEYERAQKVRDRFFASLSPAQRKLHEDITVYVSYLETVGPKLAHYYGYLLGNKILYRVIPGYYPDMLQTTQYCTILEHYFGKHFD